MSLSSIYTHCVLVGERLGWEVEKAKESVQQVVAVSLCALLLRPAWVGARDWAQDLFSGVIQLSVGLAIWHNKKVEAFVKGQGEAQRLAIVMVFFAFFFFPPLVAKSIGSFLFHPISYTEASCQGLYYSCFYIFSLYVWGKCTS